MKDPEQVLAYFERLYKLQTWCTLYFGSGKEAEAFKCFILDVAGEARTFLVHSQRALPAKLKKGATFDFVFPIDDGRFSCQVVALMREDYLQYRFKLPVKIMDADRRTHKRAGFLKTPATVTLLEQVDRGLGVTAKLVDLGLGGFCLQVNRIVQMETDQRLPLSIASFPVDKVFTLARISDLPHAPVVEASVRVAHAATRSGALLVGLEFLDLGEVEARVLEGVLARRIPSFLKPVFEVQTRRGQGAHLAVGSAAEGGLARWAPASPEAGPGSPAEPAPGPEIDEDHAVLAEAAKIHIPEDPTQRIDVVARLRRAGRRILVVAEDETARELIAADLSLGGYKHVTTAGSMVQAIAKGRGRLDALLVESRVGASRGLDIVQKVRELHAHEVLALLLSDGTDVREALAAKALRAILIRRSPEARQALTEALDRGLGLE